MKHRALPPATPENVEAMKRVAERVFGEGVGVFIAVAAPDAAEPSFIHSHNMTPEFMRWMLATILAAPASLTAAEDDTCA